MKTDTYIDESKVKQFKYILQIILFILPVTLHAGNVMTVENDTTQPGEIVEVSLFVTNDDPFVSFQADIGIPEGFEYIENSATLNPDRSNGHSFTAFITGEGNLRLLSYSMDNEAFEGSGGEVAHFRLLAAESSGLYPLELTNAIIGDELSQNILTSAESGSVTVMGPLSVNPSAEEELLCLGNCTLLAANAEGGTGNYEISWTSEPPGFSSSQGIVNVCPVETTTYFLEVFDGENTISGQITIEVEYPAGVDAGSDASVCSFEIIALNGMVVGSETYFWETTGDGTFDNNTNLTTQYDPGPGDIESGIAELILTGETEGVCGSASDTVVYQIIPEVFLETPDSLAVCENESLALEQVQVENYSSILWSTSGDGTFSGETSPNPVYFPGEDDIENGYVILEVTATGNSPCPDLEAGIFVEVTPEPSVIAGPDTSICEGEYFTIQDSQSQNCTNLFWISSGDGLFNDSTIIHPEYIPGEVDILEGEVVLYLLGTGQSPCTSAVDSVRLLINPPPGADAGEEQIILDTAFCKVESASAVNYSALHWTTEGDGTFTEQNTINPVYHPGQADIDSGRVNIRLWAFGLDGCNDASDYKTIYIVSTNNIVRAKGGDVYPQDTIEVGIEVTNETPFSEISGLIDCPESFIFLEESIYLTERASNHILIDSILPESCMAFSAYSPTGDPFLGNQGDVLRFSLIASNQPGKYPVKLRNVVLRDTLNNNILGAAIGDSINVLNPVSNSFEAVNKAVQMDIISLDHNRLKVHIHGPESSHGTLFLFDVRGRIIDHKSIKYINKSSKVISFQNPVKGVMILDLRLLSGGEIIRKNKKIVNH